MVRDRAAILDMLPAVALLLAVQGSLIMLDPDGGASAWNLAWSLLPIVPTLWLVWGQLRSLRRADEYQRVVQLEAMAIGFAVMVVASLTAGLIDAAGLGDPRQSLQITAITGILAWEAALAIKTRAAR